MAEGRQEAGGELSTWAPRSIHLEALGPPGLDPGVLGFQLDRQGRQGAAWGLERALGDRLPPTTHL